MAMSWLLCALLVAPVLADVCHSRHFRELRGNEDDDYILYGLTQDCQIFFIRPPQLSLLSTLNVNIYSSYCYPNLAQLVLKVGTAKKEEFFQSDDTLLLLLKQGENRICTLTIQIPPAEILFGDHLFSYSILQSINYAACSHSPNNEFSLHPDLSFVDSVYQNVLYFVDGNSVGEVWEVLQFNVTQEGHLQLLEKIPINNYAKHDWKGRDTASDYVIGMDVQRNYLFQRQRFEPSYLYTCAFDIMPNKVNVHYTTTSDRNYRTWLNSMSADGSLLLYTETDRTPPVTRIYGQNITGETKPHFCLGITNFAMDLGIVRTSTLRQMKLNPLPSIGEETKSTKGYKSEATTMASRGRTTTRKLSHPRTTLKHTAVVYNLTDRMVTTTRFQTTTESYEEDEEEVYVTTPDIAPVTLSTDSTEIGMMTSAERSLLNSTLDALNQNQTASSRNPLPHITVTVLVFYRLL